MQCFGKSLIRITIGCLILTILTAIPVMASVYEASLLVQETVGTTHEMLGMRVPANVTWWAANGYIDADGRDTRVMRESNERPHMLHEDYVLFADSVTGYTTTTYQVATGEMAQDMSIVSGDGGYVLVADAATIELGANFKVEYYGYTGIAGIKVHKPVSFWIDDDGVGNIQAALLTNSDTLPTGFVDGGGTWANEAQAYDNNIVTAATENVGAGVWGNYLEFTHAAMDIEGVRYYIDIAAHDVGDLVDIDVYDGAWNNLYQGAFTGGAWEINTAVYEDVTNIRFRFYNNNAGIQVASIFEAHYTNDIVSLSATAAGVADGSHKVEVWSDGANMNIEIDDVVLASVATLGAAANDYDGNWILTPDPYWGYYRHYVNMATLKINYQPQDIIYGTTLPDREGVAQDGTFVFGDNPVGIQLTMGSFVVMNQPIDLMINVGTGDTVDIVTAPENMIMEDFEMTMENNEFYFFVNWLAGISNIDVVTLWWYISSLVSICGLAVVHKYLRNIWITGFTAAGLTYFVVSMTGVEWWMAVPAVLATIFVGLWKRSAEV